MLKGRAVREMRRYRRAGCTPRELQCMALRLIKSLSEEEIGKRLGISQPVVSKHISSARERITEPLAKMREEREVRELVPGSQAWERLMSHMVEQDVEETQVLASGTEATVGWRRATLQHHGRRGA